MDDNVYPTAAPAPFFYSPTNRLLLGGGLLYLLVLFLLSGTEREKRNYARFVVLVPGLLGFLIYLSQSSEGSALGIPLQAITVCFLVWRVFQIRRFLARFMTVLVCVLLTVVTLIELAGSAAIIVGLIYGLVVAFPIVVLHRFIQNGVTGRRVAGGLIVGVGLPFIPALFLITLSSASFSAYLYALLFLASGAVPLACLVLWNSWAREVAIGYFREDPVEPERVWLKEIGNP